MQKTSRYLGCLLGLAAGDATGTTVEFEAPGSFAPVTDMTGGGPFSLNAGEWTDDTSMALCLAESLIATGRFDALDQIERYVRWYEEGHLSSNGVCFDIGNTVKAALLKFAQTGQPFAGSTDPYAAGNGSLMRLAPIPMAYAQDPEKAIEMAGESSRTTHGARVAVDACRYMSALIVGALNGAGKEELLCDLYDPTGCGYWQRYPLCPEIEAIARGSFSAQPPAIKGSGYSAQSLEAALWAFNKSTSFKDGCLLAVNLGDDADTTAAIYGQLAGAFYGVDSIPEQWRSQLALGETLEKFARDLESLSDRGVE